MVDPSIRNNLSEQCIVVEVFEREGGEEEEEWVPQEDKSADFVRGVDLVMEGNVDIDCLVVPTIYLRVNTCKITKICNMLDTCKTYK